MLVIYTYRQIQLPLSKRGFRKVENRKKVEMNATKFCPLWENEVRNAVKCLKESCTFWVDGECAIVKIAKAVTRDNEDKD